MHAYYVQGIVGAIEMNSTVEIGSSMEKINKLWLDLTGQLGAELWFDSPAYISEKNPSCCLFANV